MTTTCLCPALSSGGSYGEEETLEAMNKFRKFYEDKLREIDIEGGGDCLELKLKLQERWIKDLTEQTEMMAKIVKELEEEATARVRMLEDKLRQTSKAAYEVMKRYQTYNITHNLDEPFQKVFYVENDLKNLLEFIRRIRDDCKWSIDGLQFYDVTYNDLFGREQSCECDETPKDAIVVPVSNGLDSKKDTSCNTEIENSEFEEILKKKAEEYEALKQSMLDMRSALTEEVACKHDMISALKKDVQQLEERCLQADKQTAFKDDIIKELRKEIKQLKQQLKKENAEKKSEEVENLEKKLQAAEDKIRQMKPRVIMTTAWTAMDDLSDREKELEDEICRRQCEVEELKCKCSDLEKALESSQARAENLQKAVDLYLNSINVLEASEERARIEIEQQRVTIVNLQEALVTVKQELDEIRQKNQQDVESQQFLVNVLSANLIDLEDRNEALGMELSLLTKSYKKLQDCTFELEVEHFNSLQDIAILETQLHKYQNEFRSLEDSKYGTRSEVKKLRQQKRCYEHALECFRNEMSVMSEQLIHLQEILKLSNQSCKEENGQLYKAIVDLQQICDRLQVQLIEAEKKVLVENQMNQLKDQKIDELQLIIGQKNADLNVHDEAIHDMKLKLENAVIENHELQNTIVSLNSTIMQLQCALASRDGVCKSKSTVGRKSMSSFKDDLEKRDRKYEKLQMDYKAQYEMLKALQKEFDKVKEKDKMKTKALKRQNEALQEKLVSSESNNQHLIEELGSLRDQTTQMAQRDCCREHEMVQNKQIILELRQTLIELNESLAESELHQTALAEVFQKKVHEDRQQEDLYLSCRCEIALYKKLMEDFKQSFEEAKKNLTDMKIQNKSLTEQLKHKENKLNEMQKKLAKKEKETSQNFKEMAEKLKRSQEEEKRLSEFIENLKGEIQKRIAHNNEKDVRRPGFCPCNKMENFPYDDIDGMATTHEEIASLKIEIKRMIQNQLALNNENDKLLKQVTCLQTTVTTLEGKNCNLKQKVEKAQLENQKLRENNKQLSREKETFAQMVRNLEIELAETRNCRDDVCEESRHVVNNVKAWLEEQKKINNKVKKRAQCYCDTITKLKEENASLLNRSAAAPPTVKSNRPIKNYTSLVPPPPTIECQSPWCLDSQGLDSPRDSPSSFLTCSIEEWYSPNYRDETDFETDHEEEFVNRLEAVTLEMRNKNKKWKDKYKQDCECVVSKDNK